MAKQVIGFPNQRTYDRVLNATRRVERMPVNDGPHRGRWPKGRGGGKCPKRNEIHKLYPIGEWTDGSFDYNVTIPVNTGDVTEAVTIDWDSTAAAAQTAFETHSEIGVGDVAVSGGPLPGISLRVDFVERLAGLRIHVGAVNRGGLDGTGQGLIVVSVQDGFPKTEVEALGA